MTDAVISGLFSIGGIVLGFVLSRLTDKRKEKNEKIKTLKGIVGQLADEVKKYELLLSEALGELKGYSGTTKKASREAYCNKLFGNPNTSLMTKQDVDKIINSL